MQGAPGDHPHERMRGQQHFSDRTGSGGAGSSRRAAGQKEARGQWAWEKLPTGDPGKPLVRPQAARDQDPRKPPGVRAEGIPSALLRKACSPTSALKTETDRAKPPDRLGQP